MVEKTRVHFIGIGGSGLSAIATVLLERGYAVSGSDRQASPLMHRLEAAGARVYTHHAAENVAGADWVVRSSAVGDDNPEVLAAQAAGIPVLKRREFLERLLEGQEPVAVAGAHGKTTTTAMIAWTLFALGVDPSFVIGSVAANLGVSARAGQGRYFVIEADEYDRMFLGIRPYVAVVTNVEHDHPDCYPTPEDYEAAFRQFAGGLRPGGVLIACVDDPGARRLLDEMRSAGKAVIAYATSASAADYTARSLRPNVAGGMSFALHRRAETLVSEIALQIPGEHNVRNALAALAVVDWLGLSVPAAAAALAEFRGTARRFEVRGEVSGVVLVDDYAHHPTEIRLTLDAARGRYPGRRIWAVWQPHTYSRSRTLQNEFAAAFDAADCVLVTEIYAARETPPPEGFSGRVLADAIAEYRREPGCVAFAADLRAAGDTLLNSLEAGDVVLVLSAGDADQITARLARALPDRPVPSAKSSRRQGNA